jgi:hypothetical protein
MLMPDDARLVLPLLARLAAAAEPVSVAELAADAALAAQVPRHWHQAEQGFSWVLSCLERDRLVLGCGGGRYAITGAGLRRLDRSHASASADRDAICRAYARIDRALRTELLSRLYAMAPAAFEAAVIDLLVAMGYGRHAGSLACRLGRSGDCGIDGIVPVDELGLDTIYVQAKRYRPSTTVPVTDLRDFAGSLEQHRAGKGIFATTACFSRPAREFAAQISRRIVLIDGDRFCELMLKHNIGVRPVQRLELKEVDGGYFASAAGAAILTAQTSSASTQPRR